MKSHAEIVSGMEPKIKAQSFFSARVAEAHILDKLREVSDGYSRGEFGLGEARNKLKDFLRGERSGHNLERACEKLQEMLCSRYGSKFDLNP